MILKITGLHIINQNTTGTSVRYERSNEKKAKTEPVLPRAHRLHIYTHTHSDVVNIFSGGNRGKNQIILKD